MFTGRSTDDLEQLEHDLHEAAEILATIRHLQARAETAEAAVRQEATRFITIYGVGVEQEQRIIGLEAEIERLREALSFYADDKNWKIDAPLDVTSAYFTGGPARSALQQKDSE